MPVTFDWASKKLLHVKYCGLLSGEEAVDASLHMSADKRFDDLRAIVIDTLEITDNTAKPEHVESLISLSRIMSSTNPQIRNALVLNHDENTEALAALYTFFADDLVWEVKMFHCLEEAKSWALAVG